MSTLPARRIGDLEVSCIGMGAMTLTQTPDADPASGMRAVRAALDAGVTLFDTADSYGPSSEMGVNERALVAALREAGRDAASVVVSTKGGHTRAENASWWLDGSPEHLAAAARASLGRLGLEALPIYHLHRPDPRVPFAESLGALKQLADDGIAVRLGVSNVDEQQLAQAIAVLGPLLVSVQNEYSPVARRAEPVIRACEEGGIAFLAWGPLGGMRAAKELGGAAAAFGDVARARGVSPQRIAIAWLLASSPAVIPIPGASRPESIRDSVAAAEFVLDDAEMRMLNEAAG
jgi:aryl-alcohol dehydrogenase-like predicted oxidoreductase